MFVRRTLVRAALLAVGVTALCGSGGALADPFTLKSSAFKDGTMLDKKNAGNIKDNPNCIGDNMSPPLSWSNVPAGANSLAIVMSDPAGRQGLGVVHWVAYGIAAAATGFPEGEVSHPSKRYVGGKGTRGLDYYLGPCPRPGTGLHHYTFTLIATDLDPGELPPGLTRDELFAKLAGHTKGAAGLIGLFGRP